MFWKNAQKEALHTHSDGRATARGRACSRVLRTPNTPKTPAASAFSPQYRPREAARLLLKFTLCSHFLAIFPVWRVALDRAACASHPPLFRVKGTPPWTHRRSHKRKTAFSHPVWGCFGVFGSFFRHFFISPLTFSPKACIIEENH